MLYLYIVITIEIEPITYEVKEEVGFVTWRIIASGPVPNNTIVRLTDVTTALSDTVLELIDLAVVPNDTVSRLIEATGELAKSMH